MTAGRPAALLAVLSLALPAIALVLSLPSQPLIWRVLNNAAHAPVFGALAVVLLLLTRRWSARPAWAQYGGAFSLTVLAGAAIEWIQPSLGRAGEWQDLWTDALGACAGLAAAAFFSLPRRWLSAFLFTVATAAAFWPVAEAALGYWQRMRQFPTVMDFSSRPDWYFIRTRGLTFEVGELPGAWSRPQDPPSLHLRVIGGDWPGITHVEPQPDWRGHTQLMLDLTNPGDEPLTLTLRVHDERHDNRWRDRFNRTFTLAPSARRLLAIPLTDIARAPVGRALDLARVAGLILYGVSGRADAGREYYLTRIWLE